MVPLSKRRWENVTTKKDKLAFYDLQFQIWYLPVTKLLKICVLDNLTSWVLCDVFHVVGCALMYKRTVNIDKFCLYKCNDLDADELDAIDHDESANYALCSP